MLKSICTFEFIAYFMRISHTQFYKHLLSHFPHDPTIGQDKVLYDLALYLVDLNHKVLYMLKGYAGTGKTSIIVTLVKSIAQIDKKVVLMAPTGRAAKVMSNYAKTPAFTIHKKIYLPKKEHGSYAYGLMPNKHTNTLFVVDEASMIPDQGVKIFDNKSLLDDLLNFVYHGKNCQLMLIGDVAQLPPVNLEVSPALDPHYITAHYQLKVKTKELTEVIRQKSDSGILFNATHIRNRISSNVIENIKFDLNFSDIQLLNDSYDIQDALLNSYQNRGIEETAIIVRSNKRANLYNRQIRYNILGYDGEIEVGDYLMVVKNNYHWLSDSNQVSFIANGDICELIHIHKVKELYGFKFADVSLRLIDYPAQSPFDTMILLDTLNSEGPALTKDQSLALYTEINQDYMDEMNKYKRLQAVKKDPYFNALQVKFAYAMTCHKSQGGQWDHVFVEKPYLPDGPDISYLRWLYTAITRAKKNIYLLGFTDERTQN